MSKAPAKTFTYAQKWGEEDPFVKKGHAQIPALLFEYGARLLLEPDEAYLVCHVLRFKFTSSDEGPSERRLAELLGKSDDTVRKLLHRLANRGYLVIERTRGDLGYYTHTTYNFSGLRSLLNECYYQDHPQERPKGKRPLPLPQKSQATPQPRGVVRQRQASRETAPASAAEQGRPPPQSCGTLKSLIDEEEKEEILPSAFSEQKGTATAAWGSLADDEKQPYREQAEREWAASCTTAKVKPRPRQVEARAKTIYEKGAFAFAPGEDGVWA